MLNSNMSYDQLIVYILLKMYNLKINPFIHSMSNNTPDIVFTHRVTSTYDTVSCWYYYFMNRKTSYIMTTVD